MEIIFRLEHQIIARADHNVLAAKSRNYVRAKFELLSDDWTAPITAIFNNYTMVLDENNSCVVPWEVLEQPGAFRVSAFCGDLHTTTQESVQVVDSGYTEGETPLPPTPSVYLELTKMVQTAVESVQSIGEEARQSQQEAQTAATDAATSATTAAQKAAESSDSAASAMECKESAVHSAAAASESADQAITAAQSSADHAATAKDCADAADSSRAYAAASAQSAAQSAQEATDAAASVPAVDDTQATTENLWSAGKISQEMGRFSQEVDNISRNVDYLLGVNFPETWEAIRLSLEKGLADNYFSIGDQLKPNWTDGTTSYEDPFNIVQMNRTYQLESGAMIPGMMLQQHYTNVKACPFDAQEALYDAEEELPAGTYHFTVAGDTWLGTENGKVIQFTLTKPIPAGGQLVYADTEGYNRVLAGQKINTYSSPTSFTAIESVVLSEGSKGIDLGVTDGKGNLNHHQRAFRGSGRWKTSMLRQYLNSDKPAGQWWTKQDKWDRASAFHTQCPGYLAGFDEDFLSAIKPVKVTTARDYVSLDGGTDITYDRFFPVSLEQLNAVPSVSGIEGEALDYWKEIASHDTTGNLDNGRFKQYGTYPILKSYALNAKAAVRNCWLRSAGRGLSYVVFDILSSGMLTDGNAVYDNFCAPACVIG